jgi:predicted XRE-type DNA-binding protein
MPSSPPAARPRRNSKTSRRRPARGHKRTSERASEEMHFEESSGNVFADLGLPHPEERLAKAHLALKIGRIIKARKLTQQAAAKLMGIDQPKVSHVLTGRLAGYSTERLIGFLTALGRDIEIVVRPASRRRRRRRSCRLSR